MIGLFGKQEDGPLFGDEPTRARTNPIDEQARSASRREPSTRTKDPENNFPKFESEQVAQQYIDGVINISGPNYVADMFLKGEQADRDGHNADRRTTVAERKLALAEEDNNKLKVQQRVDQEKIGALEGQIRDLQASQRVEAEFRNQPERSIEANPLNSLLDSLGVKGQLTPEQTRNLLSAIRKNAARVLHPDVVGGDPKAPALQNANAALDSMESMIK